MEKPKNIDDYISRFPAQTRLGLEQIRATIKKLAPAAEETISYGIPAFNLNGRYLVYFAGYKQHISIYPVPSGNKAFEKDFAPYDTSGKGTIQFPLEKPIPLSLVTKIVRFLMKVNLAKAAATKKSKERKGMGKGKKMSQIL